MGQLRHQWDLQPGSDLVWLAMLIESLEWVSRADVRAVPCDPALLNAVHDRLTRPGLVQPAALN